MTIWTARKVTIRDVEFASCADACKFYGVSRNAAKTRVYNRGQTWEDAIECLIIKKEQNPDPKALHSAGKLPMRPYKPWPGKMDE